MVLFIFKMVADLFELKFKIFDFAFDIDEVIAFVVKRLFRFFVLDHGGSNGGHVPCTVAFI